MNLIKDIDSEKMTNLTTPQANDAAKLSYYYVQGFGISEEDIRRYQKDVTEGTNLESLVKLAFCYYFGDNIPINIPKAIEYLKHAADQSHPYAQYYMGVLYFGSEVE